MSLSVVLICCLYLLSSSVVLFVVEEREGGEGGQGGKVDLHPHSNNPLWRVRNNILFSGELFAVIQNVFSVFGIAKVL